MKNRARRIWGLKIMLNGFKNFLTLLVLISAALTISAMAHAALAEDWSSYSPAHSLGSEDSDWWTVYPDQNIESGSEVEHPSWVLDALKEKPALILVHSSNCKPCLVQIPRIKETVQSFKDNLSYYDVLAEGSGYQKAISVLDVYNPTGEAQYVPTTIFVTLIKDSDGKVQVGWHSAIDAMSADDINAYTKDSIYYYMQNAAEWK
jgi:thiol-disulfide isomerase/thioredoxin